VKVSGYTTTYNCIEMEYPYLAALESLAGFCDEICVADGGSRDGTVESIRARFPGVRIEVHPVDFDDPRWAIRMDGDLKSVARRMCSGDVLWQADIDEIVHPDDVRAAREVCRRALEARRLIALPFRDFWGDLDTLRSDVTPRPRVSPNFAGVVHGVPADVRETDAQGNTYPRPFVSDTCEYIDAASGSRVRYDTADAPAVWHVSWLDLRRKIAHYRRFWHRFHRSMYNLPLEDTAEGNVMFDKPWADVTDMDVERMAATLRVRGPRIFHGRVIDWQGMSRRRRPDERVPPALEHWHARQRTPST
jgi:glycosyltransferase involved in cell wall biosynthesis